MVKISDKVPDKVKFCPNCGYSSGNKNETVQRTGLSSTMLKSGFWEKENNYEFSIAILPGVPLY